MRCRFCKKKLNQVFLDLGHTPISNDYLKKSDLKKHEKTYPLKILVCKNCWLVQTQNISLSPDQIFRKDYAYLSSTSKKWLSHANQYSSMIIKKLKLNSKSLVTEIACNDGYLLKNFKKKKIPCIGIEPAINTTKFTKKIGVRLFNAFFSANFAKNFMKNYKSDLVIANNVLAHVPNIKDFVKGIKLILKKNGVCTIEFPHLLNLIKNVQFDTVYHEHYSYLSLYTVKKIFDSVGLEIWNVEELPTHGGSLRVYASHKNSNFDKSRVVAKILLKERNMGLQKNKTYKNFQKKVDKVKINFLEYLIKAKKKNQFIVAFGASAKANTFFNYIGIKNDIIKYVCDSSKSKQDKYLPGSHLYINNPNILKYDKPDIIIITTWNILNEIYDLIKNKLNFKGRLMTYIPNINEKKIN